MLRRAFLRWALASLLGLALTGLAMLGACAAPTLPVPPPTALVEEPPGPDGIATVRGSARPGVFVACLNERTEEGVIVRSDLVTGEYEVRIAAQSDDVLTLWQFESSAPGGEQIRVVVPSR